MTLNLTMPGYEELKPRIAVFGVGGAGGNAVNNMIEKELEGVEFVVANTDAQALQQSQSSSRVQLGVKVTEGLGAGARPTVGAAAAEENIEQIIDHLAGAHMCFITAGMGGGTGTGATPIIAQAARELGVLTVGVVTKPFQFEGAKRMRQAEEGIETLQKVVDTLIIIPNQNLFRLATEKTTFTEAFSMADDVLYQGVKGVTDLMVRPGLINLDFADVRAVMDEMGKAMMGTGEGEGEDRAVHAAEKAIANPLLDEISLKGARGVLINITGGNDLTLYELDEAANRIREEVDPEANIIVGSTLDPSLEGAMRVSVVATGIDARRDSAGELVDAYSRTEAVADTLQDVAVAESQAVAAEFVAPSEPEPTLFDGAGTESGYSDHQENAVAEDVFEPAAYGHDYEQHAAPEMAEPASEMREAAEQNYRHSGAPTAETLARLHAAVTKPAAEGGYQDRPASYQLSADRRESAAPQSAEPRSGDRSKFGINSLINRMTGQGETAARGGASGARPAHQETPDMDYRNAQDDDERIEVPAFLRRQAN